MLPWGLVAEDIGSGWDNLTPWPDGETMPLASTLNGYDGFATSNMAIVVSWLVMIARFFNWATGH